jgi:Ca-activated chloride channel family protein
MRWDISQKEVTHMGVTNSNKVINTDRIPCDGTLRVTLALTAAPDIVSNPTDIVLVLDRSGSMTGTPLADMKLGAKTFIDLIDEATDSSQDGQIGSGSRMGVVSFSNSSAGISTPYSSSTGCAESRRR